jgi:hypothetical protein
MARTIALHLRDLRPRRSDILGMPLGTLDEDSLTAFTDAACPNVVLDRACIALTLTDVSVVGIDARAPSRIVASLGQCPNLAAA